MIRPPYPSQTCQYTMSTMPLACSTVAGIKVLEAAEPLRGAHLVAHLTWSNDQSYIWACLHYREHHTPLASPGCMQWRGYGVQSAARMWSICVTRTCRRQSHIPY